MIWPFKKHEPVHGTVVRAIGGWRAYLPDGRPYGFYETKESAVDDLRIHASWSARRQERTGADR